MGAETPKGLSCVKISVFLRQSLQRVLECADYFSCDELELNITNERDEILFSTLYRTSSIILVKCVMTSLLNS